MVYMCPNTKAISLGCFGNAIAALVLSFPCPRRRCPSDALFVLIRDCYGAISRIHFALEQEPDGGGGARRVPLFERFPFTFGKCNKGWREGERG